MADSLQAAAPRLLRCGGDVRLLLAVPHGSDGAALRETICRQLEHEPLVVPHSGSEAALCFEVENVPLEHIIAAIVESRPDCFEAASRLHTRSDVEW
jgi:hypothetical protein